MYGVGILFYFYLDKLTTYEHGWHQPAREHSKILWRLLMTASEEAGLDLTSFFGSAVAGTVL